MPIDAGRLEPATAYVDIIALRDTERVPLRPEALSTSFNTGGRSPRRRQPPASFDQRRRIWLPLTAIERTFGRPTTITSRLPRVTVVYTGFRRSVELKYTKGFTRLGPTLATASMVVTLGLLGLALCSLPLGTAYEVWSGVGTVGTAVLGMMLFDEFATP